MGAELHEAYGILREVGTVVLIAIAWIPVIAGVWLLAAPHSFMAANRSLARAVSLRRPLRALAVPRASERRFYRYHWVSGGLLALAALYLLYAAGWQWAPHRIAEGFSGTPPSPIALWLADAGQVLLGVIGVVGLAVGLVVMVRPSALKTVEGKANRWVSTRRATRFMEAPVDAPDRWVGRHPRVAGLVILAAGIGIQLALARVVL